MKVKDLQNLLYRLDDNDDVVLLNEAAPLSATNPITGTVIAQEPLPNTQPSLNGEPENEVTFTSKLVLTYSTRDKEERKG